MSDFVSRSPRRLWHDALTGHSGRGVGRSYGGEAFPLKPLAKAIERVRYPGLNLTFPNKPPCLLRFLHSVTSFLAGIKLPCGPFTASNACSL
jgi:hypothetical protein